jgi:hypothetical protein
MNIESLKNQMVVNKGVIHFHYGYSINERTKDIVFDTFCSNAKTWYYGSAKQVKILEEAIPTDEEIVGYKICKVCLKSDKMNDDLRRFVEYRETMVAENIKMLELW